MDYRRLGKSGLKVSEFSFGAWVTFGKQVGEDDAASICEGTHERFVIDAEKFAARLAPRLAPRLGSS